MRISLPFRLQSVQILLHRTRVHPPRALRTQTEVFTRLAFLKINK